MRNLFSEISLESEFTELVEQIHNISICIYYSPKSDIVRIYALTGTSC